MTFEKLHERQIVRRDGRECLPPLQRFARARQGQAARAIVDKYSQRQVAAILPLKALESVVGHGSKHGEFRRHVCCLDVVLRRLLCPGQIAKWGNRKVGFERAPSVQRAAVCRAAHRPCRSP